MHGITIIGPGRLGGALSLALDRAGRSVEAIVYDRSPPDPALLTALSQQPRLVSFNNIDPPLSGIVLITTGDGQISTVANRIAAFVSPDAIVLHTSGSLSSEILSGLRRSIASVGSMHPLVSISDWKLGSEHFAGAYFCVEGDDVAVAAASELAQSLGGKTFSIETTRKALYHAAAVTASGHLVALADTAIEMLSLCGIDYENARQTLMPLVASTLENLKAQTPHDALTGSFARLDIGAIDRHIAAMNGNVPETMYETYLVMAERSLRLAERHGADRESVQRLRKRISIAKGNSG